MKAIQFHRYGPPEVLQVEEVATPKPKGDEVLIRIHAVAVNTGDCEIRSPHIPNTIWFLLRLYMGLFRPRKKILGAYLAGTVESIGNKGSRFQIGDEVFACSGPHFGAYAETICLPEGEAIAKKPSNMTFTEAAPVPLGLDALHFLRMAGITSGQHVLVNGAGGGIGTVAVQLAKNHGAEVTAVDRGEKLDMLKQLGADHVIDYTKEDFAQNKASYDVVFDLVGKGAYARCIKALKPGGIYLMANPSGIPQLLRGVWTTMVSNKKVISKFASASHQDMDALKEMIEAGKLKSVIDKTYSLEEVVAAHTYVESGQKKGNVVLTVEH